MTVSLIPPTELAKLTARTQELEAAVQRVRDLHEPLDLFDEDRSCCIECEYLYPCPTMQALGETK